MPKDKVTYRQLTDSVALETGYPKDKVNYIISEFIKGLLNNMYSGKLCYIDNLGLFYKMIRPARKVVDFKNKPNPEHRGRTLGTKGMKVNTKNIGAQWIPNFKFHKTTFQSFRNLQEPTEVELNDLYED